MGGSPADEWPWALARAHTREARVFLFEGFVAEEFEFDLPFSASTSDSTSKFVGFLG